MNSRDLAKKVTKALDNKKADNINVVKIDELTILTDYFVIASATNITHTKALADEVEMKVKEEYKMNPLRVEGYQAGSWIVMDYGSVIVHIFYEQTREFYNLDKLWTDGEKQDVEEFIK